MLNHYTLRREKASPLMASLDTRSPKEMHPTWRWSNFRFHKYMKLYICDTIGEIGSESTQCCVHAHTHMLQYH